MKISGGTIFVIFLILKLTGVIHWSWIWVTSPLWLPLLVIAPFIFLAGALGILTIKRRNK
jgi:hypothetical protein